MTTSIRRLAAAALLLGSVLAPSAARAWGDEGHEIIALVAYEHLEPRTRAAVDQMLGMDADPLTAPDIASRATWADKYRDSDRHTSQRRYRLTRAWHFVDIELDHPDLAAACFGHPAAPTPASAGPENACIVDRIEAFTAELHDLPPGDPERTLALKFVLHFVGDIHQPLHAADNHDNGGNNVLVLTGRETAGRPLHAYWDTGVVRQLGRDTSQVAASLDQRFGQRCRAWMAGTPSDWALESFGIARDMVYQLLQSMNVTLQATISTRGISRARASSCVSVFATSSSWPLRPCAFECITLDSDASVVHGRRGSVAKFDSNRSCRGCWRRSAKKVWGCKAPSGFARIPRPQARFNPAEPEGDAPVESGDFEPPELLMRALHDFLFQPI